MFARISSLVSFAGVPRFQYFTMYYYIESTFLVKNLPDKRQDTREKVRRAGDNLGHDQVAPEIPNVAGGNSDANLIQSVLVVHGPESAGSIQQPAASS
ncbi:hypothetical protein KQX54_001809 [Cotesia glomerata]|uniref:Uncharacterized protein n=1 Tax=Cotesia glomerata TaxID=32391 RepID=A0AAV7II83_COTGL|nr:hypothetical protein KQX54_001809 [Cotesia glomerata]